MYSNENQPNLMMAAAASRDSTATYANFTFVNIALTHSLTQSEEFVRGGVRLAFSRQIY